MLFLLNISRINLAKEKEYVMLKNWQDLPSSKDTKEEVSNFYKNLSIEEVAEYMKSVINEWRQVRIYGKGDYNVMPKELPLIEAFREKANLACLAYYSQLLAEFEKYAGDDQAEQIARELQW